MRYASIFLSLFLLISTNLLAEQKRPNILWISVEDYSPDLGCYGSTYASTPNIDKFAAHGCRYTHAFSVAPVCAPSRSSIITGMYASTIGTQYMRCKGVPPAYVKCFPEYLRAVGYYCTNDNKTDYNFDAPRTAWDENGNKAHWRNRPNKEQPFFSVINITSCHESQIRQSEASYEKLVARLQPHQVHDPEKAVVPPYYPNTPVVRQDWARYHDIGSGMDLEVGKILKDLDDDHLTENTIVFFWGDHGRGLSRGKRWLYDSGTHVPLIVRWPGKLKAGEVREQMVSLLDLGPTVLNLAGIPIPKHMQGVPFLGENLPPAREYVYGIRDRMDEAVDMMRSVRDKRYKYIRNYMPERPYAQNIDYMNKMPTMQEWRRLNAEGKLEGAQKLFFAPTKPVEELYDTQTDPHEVNNLATDAKHSDILHRLRKAHEQWSVNTQDIGLRPELEVMEQARPGGKWSVTQAPEIIIRRNTVTLKCETDGASIAYQLQNAPKTNWELYTEPFTLPEGSKIRAQAFRLGFRDSEITSQ